MTQNSTISLTFCVVVFALSLSAQTSNRQGTPAPPLFGAIPQMTQVQQENFPPQLLDQLMQDLYLLRKPPKSTGREYFGAAYVDTLTFGTRSETAP